MNVFWVDSYYWGASADGLADVLTIQQLNSGLQSPAKTIEIYSAIRNRLEKLEIDQSEEICGKIITVRYN